MFIKRKTTYEARLSWNCKLLQLSDSQLHCSRHFRVSKRYENTLVDQSKCTYYLNYFINLMRSSSLFGTRFDFWMSMALNFRTCSMYVQRYETLAVSRVDLRMSLAMNLHSRCTAVKVHSGQGAKRMPMQNLAQFSPRIHLLLKLFIFLMHSRSTHLSHRNY